MCSNDRQLGVSNSVRMFGVLFLFLFIYSRTRNANDRLGMIDNNDNTNDLHIILFPSVYHFHCLVLINFLFLLFSVASAF